MAHALTVRTVNGEQFTLEADLDLTVLDLKALCEEPSGVEFDRQKLIHKGKVLKDEDTLEDCGIKSGSTIILLRGRAPPAPEPEAQPEAKEAAQPAAATAAPAAAPAVPAAAPVANPFAAMLGGGNLQQMLGGVDMSRMPASMDMNSMRQFAAQNPDMMRSLMQSPFMQQMLSNPDLIRGIFNSNPALQSVLEENPQLRHALNDNQTLQQVMRMASNPALYNEMIRSHDRALRNIESLPGGMNHLSQMYHQVQAPMERAMDEAFAERHGTASTVVRDQAPDTSAPITSEPMPNPWRAGGAPAAAANGGGAAANPLAGLGGLGGAMGGRDPNGLAQMLGNPHMQAMMQQMAQNPQMLQSMMSGGGPAAMLGAQGTAEQKSGDGSAAAAPNPLDLSALFGALNGAAPGQPAQPAVPPEQQFAAQLQQLEDMGFPNREANLQILISTGGNLEATIARLCGAP